MVLKVINMKLCDYRRGLRLEIDGKEAFEVFDDEPEDSNLLRSFRDCMKIPDLLKQAHEAGVRGEPFTVTKETET